MRSSDRPCTELTWTKEYTAIATEYDFTLPQGMPISKANEMLPNHSRKGTFMTMEQLLHAVAQLRHDRMLEVDLQHEQNTQQPGLITLVVQHSVAKVVWQSGQQPFHHKAIAPTLLGQVAAKQ
jgi:hypothetical protein